MTDNLKLEIFSCFQQMQTVFFATCDNERPYVRPMLLLYVNDKFLVATGTEDAKTPQLKINPNFEFCYFIEKDSGHGYIRGTGRVEFIQDIQIRKHFIVKFHTSVITGRNRKTRATFCFNFMLIPLNTCVLANKPQRKFNYNL